MTEYKANINSTPYPAEFVDIAPYEAREYTERMQSLVKEPGFENAIKYVMPDVDYNEFVKMLFTVDNAHDFQRSIVGQFLEYLANKTTTGITCSGMENLKDDVSYTFMSNHRDIVLDASFLNLCFIRAHKPITQIAIGNNLLIYDWIRDLVRINRSFIVKRDVKRLQALEAAKQLSGYMHFTIAQRHESIWIAQREGRTKDSNDRTQESLLKMMILGGSGTPLESLKELNVVPVAISYEYDPNDYLKVREFLLKRRDPEFKKSQRDDLFSMETGLLQNKGKVHFHVGQPINDVLDGEHPENRNALLALACGIIDNSIHRGYKIYPINYIAYDLLTGSKRFEGCYTATEVEAAEQYWKAQTDKMQETLDAEEKCFVREMFLKMYANPLINQLESKKS